jgi:cell division protease FtsH
MLKRRGLWLVGAVLLVIALVSWRASEQSAPAAEVPFSVLTRRLLEPSPLLPAVPLQIQTSTTGPAEFRGQWKDGARFASTGVVSERFLEQLSAANVDYEIVTPSDGGVWRGLLGILPPLVLVGLFLLLLRSLKGGGGQAMNFRNSTHKRLNESQRKTTFADVAGIEEARSEVEEIVAFLINPPRFTRLGGRIPKGVLMMGPPGTGKTLLARAIAGEAGVPFFTISGSDFVEMFVGVGASRVRSLFEQAKQNAPCIIFIDEIDAVGRQRGTGWGGGNDEREQTLNQLLVEMDGFEPNGGVIIMAATNRPDVLDPALLRAGRFDRRMVIPAPDVNGRFGILQVHTRKTPLAADVDLRVIARGTTGFVGAELSNLVNEAALLAARADKDQIDMRDLEMARDKVLMGPERRSMTISAREKRVMAFRQAGHALVGKLLAGMDPIHKVTIIPHGDALGITQQLPSEDRLSMSEESAQGQLAFALAGRVAEALVFGQVTTGPADQLEAAATLARRMVCEWGMSRRVGPLSLGAHQPLFPGAPAGRSEYAEETAVEIDAEVRRLILSNEERARAIVSGNRDALNRIAEALLALETIDGAELDVLLAGGKIVREALPVQRPPVPSGDVPSGTARPALSPLALPDPAKA